ncbi:MAG: TetR/AcrR family transcriptional regulator [Anaerolineaceae bacterium]|nr:TetR/AcrR family transcriptional regulator [Anaerolineaceae bacterium]
MSSKNINSQEKTDTRTRILVTTWQLMEEHHGQGVNMSDIAKAVGISRQALYLHFASRTELMIATLRYVDEVNGLDERLGQLTGAAGIALLESSVEVWGNYIPEIYGLAKVMLSTRDTDEATAAAWDDRMGCLRDACQAIIETLAHEAILAPVWTPNEAIEMLWAMLSVSHWEQLTVECGWSNAQYIDWMKTTLRRAFVAEGASGG